MLERSWKAEARSEASVAFDDAVALLDGWVGTRVMAFVATTDPAVEVAAMSGTLRRGTAHAVAAGHPLALKSDQVEFEVGAHASFALYRERFLGGTYSAAMRTLMIAVGGCPPGGAHAETVMLDVRQA